MPQKRFEEIGERDIRKLCGGDSAQLDESFSGGSLYTGYIIERLSLGGNPFGLFWCGTGFTHRDDYVGDGEFDYDLYEARSWTEEDILGAPEVDERGAAEVQFFDTIDNRIEKDLFVRTYQSALTIAILLASYSFKEGITQGGVIPRRLIVTVIDPEKCVEGCNLSARNLERIALRREIIETLGFTLDGYLAPYADDLSVSDQRNNDEEPRAVFMMEAEEVHAFVSNNFPGFKPTNHF